jgi:hypothetical protein
LGRGELEAANGLVYFNLFLGARPANKKKLWKKKLESTRSSKCKMPTNVLIVIRRARTWAAEDHKPKNVLCEILFFCCLYVPSGVLIAKQTPAGMKIAREVSS